MHKGEPKRELRTPKPLKKCSIDLSHFNTAESSTPTKVRKFTLDFLECGEFVLSSFSETARELQVVRSSNPQSRDSFFESMNHQEVDTVQLLAGLQL